MVGRKVFGAVSAALLGTALLSTGALAAGFVSAGSADGAQTAGAPAHNVTLVSDQNVKTRALATWNMQGGNVGQEWKADVAPLAQQDSIVALQDAGPNVPAVATNVVQRTIGGYTVERGTWPVGGHNAYVYFLPADRTGHRVNLAMVTQRPADGIVVIPPISRAAERAQPAPGHEEQAPADDGTDNVATATDRPLLGLVFGDTVYYDIHARAADRGRDAPAMISRAAASAARAGRDWVVLGDFNRSPASLTAGMRAGHRPIGHTRDGYGPTHLGGGDLDYLVSNLDLGRTDDYLGERQPARGTDHLPVEFGAPLARESAQFTLNTTDGALSVDADGKFGYANPNLGSIYYPIDFDPANGTAELVSKLDGQCLANRYDALTEELCDPIEPAQDFTFDKAGPRDDPYTYELHSSADDTCLIAGLDVASSQGQSMSFGNCGSGAYWTYTRTHDARQAHEIVPK